MTGTNGLSRRVHGHDRSGELHDAISQGAALVVEQAILPATASDDRRTRVFALYNILQGAGAGAIQPIATTIVGDIYTPAERARERPRRNRYSRLTCGEPE